LLLSVIGYRIANLSNAFGIRAILFKNRLFGQFFTGFGFSQDYLGPQFLSHNREDIVKTRISRNSHLL
jgi:hypothetical protein